MKEQFGINTYNVLQDEENYYFFRALNMADNKDVEEGITIDEEGKVARIRTDRERYIENPENGTPKYNANDNLRLEQAFDHIKIHYRKDTNCISMSNDTDVVINYGRVYYKDRYVIIKIPKNELGKTVVIAGEYLLEEIEKIVKDYISSLNSKDEQDSKTLQKLEEIEKLQSTEEIKQIVKTKYWGVINSSKSCIKKGIEYRASVSRFSNYKTINENQNLEKNKLVGKLTLLERKNRYKLVPYTTNSKMIDTIWRAFNSLELLHYGYISNEKIKEVPSKVMDQLSLIQHGKENITNANDIIRKLFEN